MAVFKADETTAEAFLNTVQQYHLAARTLLPLHQQAESTFCFLFVHTNELAFTMAAFNVLVQWHGFQPNASGFVPLSIAEFSL